MKFFRDELRTNLTKLGTALSKWVATKKAAAEVQALVESLKEQLEFVRDIGEIDGHAITSLSDRFAMYIYT